MTSKGAMGWFAAGVFCMVINVHSLACLYATIVSLMLTVAHCCPSGPPLSFCVFMTGHAELLAYLLFVPLEDLGCEPPQTWNHLFLQGVLRAFAVVVVVCSMYICVHVHLQVHVCTHVQMHVGVQS